MSLYCRTCGYRARNLKALRAHERRHATTTNDTVFSGEEDCCDLFSSVSSLHPDDLDSSMIDTDYRIAMDETLLSAGINSLSLSRGNIDEDHDSIPNQQQIGLEVADQSTTSFDYDGPPIPNYSSSDSSSSANSDEYSSSSSDSTSSFWSVTSGNDPHSSLSFSFDPQSPAKGWDEENVPALDKVMAQSSELLSILKKTNAPLSLYSQISGWCQQHFDVQLPKRSNVLKYLSRRYRHDGIWPIRKACYLPGSQRTVSVVVFDLEASLQSLLSDPVLMQPENLTIDLHDPHKFPEVDEDLFDDITSGYMYELGYNEYCDNDARAVGAFLILFSDSTAIDMHGNLTSEPVTFTLSLFKASVRKRPEAWRVLGYIRNKQTKLEESEAVHDIDGLESVEDVPQEADIPGKDVLICPALLLLLFCIINFLRCLCC